MKNLKEKGIKLLCEFGKLGVRKSLTLGMYNFEIPKKLIEFDSEIDSSMKAGKGMSENVCK